MLVKQNIGTPYQTPFISTVNPDTKPVVTETPPSVPEKPKAETPKETKAKYQKFVSEIAKYSVNMKDFDFENILKNVFDIGGKLGLKPEDILSQKEIVKKFLPKVGEFLEKASTEYNNLQRNAKASGENQVSFTGGKLVFQTGQEKTEIDAQGNPVPVVQQDKKVKTRTEIDLVGMSTGIQTVQTDGSKFGTKLDVDDQTFGYNFFDADGAGQSTVVDLKKGGINTTISPDGKNNVSFSTESNGYTSLKLSQNGTGSITLAGGGNKGTVVAINSDKVGGVQVSTGKNQQTVVTTNVKTHDGNFGATVRTGNRQGTQIKLDGGKHGSVNLGISSTGFKLGATIDGKGGAFNLSLSNNAVIQTVKDGKTTTSITDDNKWDGKLTYKDEKFGTLGLNMAKHKVDSRSFTTANPDPNNDVKCKQEDLTNLETEKKKIQETPKSKRSDVQNKRIEAIESQINKLEKEIKSYGQSVEAKTEDLMSVEESGDKPKVVGHEIARQLPKGDIYQINQERTLTLGGEFGITGNAAKVSHTSSKKVDIDLSIQGLGDNKVKISVSRKVEIDKKTNVDAGSGIAKYEGEFENDKSSSYELEIDLSTDEGKNLYDKIMQSSSNFKDQLPIPEESKGVHIVSAETEDIRTKDETRKLSVPSLSTFSVDRESETKKAISQDGYEMTGDFNVTSTQKGEKVPVIGQIVSNEKIATNGNYSITPSKQDQIKTLEAKKEEIKSNTSILPEQKTIELKSIDSKIEDLKEDIQTNSDSISTLEQKKEELIKTQDLSPAEKTSKITDINKQISDKKEKLKVDTPIVQDKIKALEAKKEEIKAKVTSTIERNSQLGEVDQQISALNKELEDTKKSITDLEQSKIELCYNPEETKSSITKIDAQIHELQNDSKTSFKINITDSRVHTGEARRLNQLFNNLTTQNNQSDVKTRKYNDKSAVSVSVELFADPKDIQTIITSTKAQFLQAAKDTPGITKSGDGVRRLEVKLDRAEERANKSADEKGLKKPSPERDALIQAEKLDIVMSFVEKNGKDGVAFLQKLTGNNIEVKTSEVSIEGFKADSIISDEKIQGFGKKSIEIGADSKVDRKEAKEVRSMKKEALAKKEELESKIFKIDTNPMLNPSQKLELKANITIKLEKLNEMIGKLNALGQMREDTISGED